jgi:formylglycine-generating enzyme required for sulfatase activity
LVQDFIKPEQERLLAELEDINTSHQRRSAIGERLSLIGDPRPGVGLRPDGLPDIAWCRVPPLDWTGAVHKERGLVKGLFGRGEREVIEVEIKDIGKVKVEAPFYIARYPITYRQFQAFIDAPDGYASRETDWFVGLLVSEDFKHFWEQFFKADNRPRETVNWYQALAFCRWLSAALGYAITLPTEAQWQLAATLGEPARPYPWGFWDARFVNTSESGLQRTTAVGMYPQGISPCGALDMSGNVREWTLTEYESGRSDDISNNNSRVLRGGSWSYPQKSAYAVYRYRDYPYNRDHNWGFRVVSVSPSLNP